MLSINGTLDDLLICYNSNTTTDMYWKLPTGVYISASSEVYSVTRGGASNDSFQYITLTINDDISDITGQYQCITGDQSISVWIVSSHFNSKYITPLSLFTLYSPYKDLLHLLKYQQQIQPFYNFSACFVVPMAT